MNAKIFTHNRGTHLDYLQDAYRILINSYYELRAKKYSADNCNENKIRDDLVIIAEKEKSKLFFRWTPESLDLDENSRIDIELVTPFSLREDKLGIKIECKIVKNGSEYIDTYENNVKGRTNGIMGFIRGKYSSKMPLAGMVGFVKEGNIDNKIDSIKNKIKEHKTIKTIKNLTFYKIEKDFKYSYFSQHKRMDKLPKIYLYHLFFDFNNIFDQ